MDVNPLHWMHPHAQSAAVAAPTPESVAPLLGVIPPHDAPTAPIQLPAPAPEETSVPEATVLAPAPAAETGFVRFIDEVKAFFVAAAPVAQEVETAAVAAEPILALTPAGPEYSLAVNAIVGAQQIAQASLAAGTTLTGTQKAQIAVSAATPALNAILSSKGVTTGTETIISTWIQNVFNILAGPVAALVEGKKAA